MINRLFQAASLMSENPPGRGFIPGADVSGVNDPPSFPDAADALLDSSTLTHFLEPMDYYYSLMEHDIEGDYLEHRKLLKVNWSSPLEWQVIRRV